MLHEYVFHLGQGIHSCETDKMTDGLDVVYMATRIP